MSDNFKSEVYIYIGEFSYLLFKESLATSYIAWCCNVQGNLLSGTMDEILMRKIDVISNNVNMILDIDTSIISRVVMEYFIFEEYHNTHKVISMSRNLYGGYVAKNNVYKRLKKDFNECKF